MNPSPPIRVASVPAAHPYVEHLTDPDHLDDTDEGGRGIVRLPDPPPDVADPLPGQWWPPRVLEPGWIDAHAAEIDLVHLHFGFDAADPAGLRDWVAALDTHRIPLVMTVHDLVNPHFADQRGHLAHLDVLVPAATELITLTAGAAAEIARGWGRTATVVPHPHVVPLAQLRDPVPPRPTLTVGVHAKSLRANLDPLPVLQALLVSTGQLPDLRVQVHRHPDLATRTDDRARALTAFLADRAADPAWTVLTHDRYDDEELWTALTSVDVCVLPYGFGTHSGWLEACVDLGVGVIVPDVGHYAGQHGHPTLHRLADGGVDAEALTDTLRRVSADRAVAGPPRPDRRGQRREIARAHAAVYRRALGRA
ncbi:glycosyltransferase [Nakamurella flavida]|uniref:Glycosyltransferase n=1 Tax=Nakamurella flavida TaxID=363630 RepID=A0A938YRL0_9ACTN|nr:glycosyltransferase [Nakamurella flavida]MBM9478174.1 glycosyltransferase [Nakamurella flavida]MDP9778604.1 hypothetical protein [Nakamurella flavida]